MAGLDMRDEVVDQLPVPPQDRLVAGGELIEAVPHYPEPGVISGGDRPRRIVVVEDEEDMLGLVPEAGILEGLPRDLVQRDRGDGGGLLGLVRGQAALCFFADPDGLQLDGDAVHIQVGALGLVGGQAQDRLLDHRAGDPGDLVLPRRPAEDPGPVHLSQGLALGGSQPCLQLGPAEGVVASEGSVSLAHLPAPPEKILFQSLGSYGILPQMMIL